MDVDLRRIAFSNRNLELFSTHTVQGYLESQGWEYSQTDGPFAIWRKGTKYYVCQPLIDGASDYGARVHDMCREVADVHGVYPLDVFRELIACLDDISELELVKPGDSYQHR